MEWGGVACWPYFALICAVQERPKVSLAKRTTENHVKHGGGQRERSSSAQTIDWEHTSNRECQAMAKVVSNNAAG